MALQSVITINFLLLLSSGLAEAAPIAKPGCTSVCKNVSIPYPFGILSGCYMDPWFEIVCNGTGAFLKKINMEVLEIALERITSSDGNTVRVKGGSIISSNPNCTSMRSGVTNLKGSPFTFSSFYNYFVSFGCNVIATIADTDQQVVGCKSRCNTSLINGARNSSSGFNHCIGPIPEYLQVFNVDFASTDNKVLEGCNYAFLTDGSGLEMLEFIKTVEKVDFIPVVLNWQIYNWTNGWREMLDSFDNRRDFQCDIYTFPTSSSNYYWSEAKSFHNTISKHYDEISSLICNCAWGYEGNPFLSAGCEGKFPVPVSFYLVNTVAIC